MAENSTSSGGIGFFGLLGVCFIVLKIMGIIKWSWWWVTLPLWGGAAFVLSVLLLILLIGLLVATVSARK